ncbi:MAG: PAS domain S-box protein [Deltaproteobacteria bacterium]|nr:PAS domain S-box protein [Deltaproteobacteria bacterium]
MFLRVLFVSLLLGASIFVQVRETKAYFGDIQTFHYLLIATIYCLTFIYAVLLKYLRDLTKFAYAQLLLDTFLVTAIIYATGGIESIFSFLYILTIINGSIILYRKGGMLIASSSSILYGVLLDLHYYGAVHPLGSRMVYPLQYQTAYLFYIIVVNIAAFYLVAFLSSYPSEQARRSRVELRAKENDIVKLEVLNERIIRSITSGLMTIDGTDRIILFNPAAEEIFTVPAAQVIGRRVQDLLPFLGGHLEDVDRGEQDSRRPHTFIELPYLRPDGREIFLSFSISPLSLPGGGQKGKILFFQDMTEIRQIEEEKKRMEDLALIGELAAGIAHEIRNPMASISGSIQMLKEGLAKDEVNERLMDIVLREISRLNKLVNDFLLFARPKQINLEVFDLNQLILDSLELSRNSGKWSEKIRVVTDFRGSLEMESDPEKIKQVLWNLFLNASEAMSGGGVLTIETERVRESEEEGSKGGTVRISIRDSGAGFSRKAILHLFTPFFTTKEGGSGLGLAIVKGIVEGLKGKVYGKNHSEGGAEITLLLPRTPHAFR